MAHLQQATRTTLLQHGFRPYYESAAVTLLKHPEHPGHVVRLGVTRVVVERETREIYRAAYGDFSVERLLTTISTQE